MKYTVTYTKIVTMISPDVDTSANAIIAVLGGQGTPISESTSNTSARPVPAAKTATAPASSPAPAPTAPSAAAPAPAAPAA